MKRDEFSTYAKKLAINSTFEEIIKVSATPYKPEPKKADKPKKKK
jgi:hypothetical protein